jgi:hypothetical protein
MTFATVAPARNLVVPTAWPEAFAEDEEDSSRADIWTVLDSLRSARMSAQERDAEDERFIALMLGGDPFD